MFPDQQALQNAWRSSNKQYPPSQENIAFLFKTGESVVWERLPIHILTSFKDITNVKVYGDTELTIAGIKIHDALANISKPAIMEHGEMEPYSIQKFLQIVHGNYDLKEAGMHNGWLLDRFKNIWMLYDAYQTMPNIEWYIVLDDDTAVWPQSIVAGLPQDNGPWYIGSPTKGGFAHGGSGFAVSRTALDFVFSDPIKASDTLYKLTQKLLTKSDLGDEMVALLLKGYVKLTPSKLFQGETSYHVKHSLETMCEPLGTFHHVSVREIQQLHDFKHFLNTSKPITYWDHFAFFSAPYLVNSIKGWSNKSKSHKTSAKSSLSCKSLCEAKHECIQWEFDPYIEECRFNFDVVLGRPVLFYDDERTIPKFEIESGWILEKVQKIIQKKNCANRNTIQDIELGWWWNAMDKWENDEQ